MNHESQSCPSGRFRRIRNGDTLYLIALQLGVKVDELLELNPGIDPNNLQAGQVICLPPERICPSGVFWVVAPGDTLYKIARETGATVAELLELNPDVNPVNLQVDQTICLPE